MTNKFFMAILLISLSTTIPQLLAQETYSGFDLLEDLGPFIETYTREATQPEPAYIPQPGNGTGQVILFKNDIEVDIVDSLATIKFTQYYRNVSDGDVNTTYVFPLHNGMAVGALKTTVDDIVLIAEVRTKEEAKKLFDDAIKNNLFAVRAEYYRDATDLFQMNIGNLDQNNNVKVEMTVFKYVEIVTGKYQFNLPQGFANRYDRNKDDTSSRRLLDQVEYEWSFSLKLRSSQNIISLQSGTYPSTNEVTNTSDGDVWTATLDDQSNLSADREIIFTYELSDMTSPTMLQQTDAKHDSQMAVMISYIQGSSGSQNSSVPVEYLFLIDRSGSMTGHTMAATRKAVISLLGKLPDNSRFNVYSFGSTVELMYQESMTTSTQVDDAVAKVNDFYADMGATSIINGITRAVQTEIPSGFHRVIFFFTDGAVASSQSVVDFVKSNIGDQALYTFGMGSGAARTLTTNLSNVGNGWSYFINSATGVEEILTDAYQKSRQKVKKDISVTIEKQNEVQWMSYPKLLFDNQPFIINLIVNKDWTSTTATVKIGSINYSLEIDLTTISKRTVTTSEGNLFKITAKALIDELERENGASEDIVALSTTYGIASSKTDFIAVQYKMEDGDLVNDDDNLEEPDKELDKRDPGKNPADNIDDTLDSSSRTQLRWILFIILLISFNLFQLF